MAGSHPRAQRVYAQCTSSRKPEGEAMAKSSGGAGKAGGGNSGGGRGPSSHPGPGGNWPSTTGKVSGGGRGNAPSKGGKG